MLLWLMLSESLHQARGEGILVCSDQRENDEVNFLNPCARAQTPTICFPTAKLLFMFLIYKPSLLQGGMFYSILKSMVNDKPKG